MTLAGVDLGSYAVALGITLAVEIPVVAAFFPGRRRRMALACAVATTVTHVLLYFVFPVFILRRDLSLLVGEAVATLAEAGAYYAVGREPGRALVAAAVANTCSFAIGVVIFVFPD